jgi:ATP-dependent helicase/nuclease subunit B
VRHPRRTIADVSLVVLPVTAGIAHRALAAAVRDAKQGDVLRPITVIVPTNAAGVMARRTLGRLGGVAAVDFITLYRLAERLAGPALRAQQRLPVSTAVVDLAVRSILRDTRTAFDEVAQHQSTVVALRDIHRELRTAGTTALEQLERASSRGREVARVSRRVADRLAPRWYDEGDLIREATGVVRAGALEPALSRVVVFLPQALGALDADLVRAIGDQGSVQIVLGLSGDVTADRDVLAAARSLSSERVAPVVPASVAATEIVSVTDADEEVRHAVRAVVDAARRGTPLASMAVLWPTDRPYARLVEHHLGVAGIDWNGRPGTKVSERLVPRFLLDLLDVDRRGFRRRDLFDLLADVPARDSSGRPLPVAAWERASRDAGVVKDDQWTPRLKAYAVRQRRRVEERRREHEEPPEVPAASPHADAAESLVGFVGDLRRQLGHRGATRSWSDWADWSEVQIASRLGAARLQHLDEPEYQAWEHTTRVLDRLRHLDAVGSPPTRGEFRSVFAAEFDVAPGRLGRIGAGVTIGSLAGSVGLVAEFVIVLGAAEGLLPAPPTVDPLLSDHDRRSAGLPTSDTVAARAHRQLLGLLDSVPRVMITTPRGDLRNSTQRQQSRWVAPLPAAVYTSVASHVSGLLDTKFPAHAGEHRLRRRSADVLHQGSRVLVTAAADDADSALTRALSLRAARRSDLLTEFDGDLSGVGVPAFVAPVSPTQLQSWAACPHAYFVQYMLGVRPLEEPGDELGITPLDRGNALHEVLDLFNREVIAGTLPQPGAHGWGDAHRQRLFELLEVTADRFEHAGRTGRPASWAIERKRLHKELQVWVENDSAKVAARHARVIASEQRFGADGEVTLALPGGRRLSVFGSVDRIDRTPAGLVVTDHKVGGDTSYAAIDRSDPTAGRTRFQLPAYAAAATVIAAGLGESRGDGTVLAEYGFFEKGGFKRIGYELDDDVWTRVATDLQHVVSGIEAGWFPATPLKPQFTFYVDCHFCEPDALGTTERWPEWDRKRLDPRLSQWFAVEPPGEGHP